jgi:hypothetical protein
MLNRTATKPPHAPRNLQCHYYYPLTVLRSMYKKHLSYVLCPFNHVPNIVLVSYTTGSHPSLALHSKYFS